MPTILLVEDEAAIAESLAYSLRRDGFQVACAGTLAEAHRELPGSDLVVLDLMLPDGSGFDLLHAIRASRPAPAVIVLSSRDDESDRVAALETGADDYVTKPFSPREVVARVRAVLRRANADAPPGAPLERERPRGPIPLEVELDTRRASVGGRALEVTKVEFDLLACLLAAPGRVFSRAQIIDRVWGDGFAISDRTIDSHMKALRRKVGERGGDPSWLETVRGVGYRVSDGSERPGAERPDEPAREATR